MDGVVLPSCKLFGLRWPSPGAFGLSGRVNGELQEHLHQEAPSRTAAASAPIPKERHCRPIPPWGILQHLQVGRVQSPVGLPLLSPGSWNEQDCVCALQWWSLCFLLPCGSPIIKFHWCSKSDSLGIASPFAGSLGWGDWYEAQKLHYGGKTTLVLLFSRFWWVRDLILPCLHTSCHLVVASSLSLDVGYLILVGSSVLLWMVAQ